MGTIKLEAHYCSMRRKDCYLANYYGECTQSECTNYEVSNYAGTKTEFSFGGNWSDDND